MGMTGPFQEKSSFKPALVSENSVELLKELHLLTNQGKLNSDARRKIKQVNHLFNLIAPALRELSERHPDFQIVDVGAGKGYLGFMLYEIAFKNSDFGQILSIEERKELVASASAMAQRLGFLRMKFQAAKIAEADLPERVHLVTALHACDTATDDAIILGIKKRADFIAVVPCCQAEVASLLKDSDESVISELWHHGIHRREFGSQLTNVLRVLVLESLGYQVSVTELVGWEHSLKNEFIFAKRIHRENPKAKERLQKFTSVFKVSPKILRFFENL